MAILAPPEAPLPLEHQVMSIHPVTKGYLDNVPVERIKESEATLDRHVTRTYGHLGRWYRLRLPGGHWVSGALSQHRHRSFWSTVRSIAPTLRKAKAQLQEAVERYPAPHEASLEPTLHIVITDQLDQRHNCHLRGG